MEPLLNLTARTLRTRETSEYPLHGGNLLDFTMPKTPVPPTPKLALGRRIYYNACVYCHGVEGRGQGFLVCPKSPLQGKIFKPDEIVRIIQKPVFPMPPLRMMASEEQALAEYVYLLERGTVYTPEPAAPSAAPSTAL